MVGRGHTSGHGAYDTLPQRRLLSRFLDTNGDGTGTKNANGNYSGAVEEFYIQPAADEVMQIARLLISIEDTTGMQANEYGDLGSALGNGITIEEERNGTVVTDFTDGVPITTNAEWGTLCYDVDVKSWGQTPTNELLVARFTFARSERNVRLEGTSPTPDRLVVSLNDTLTGLIRHTFMVQGFYEHIVE